MLLRYSIGAWISGRISKKKPYRIAAVFGFRVDIRKGIWHSNSMNKKMLLLVLCAASFLLFSGCMSMRSITTVKPGIDTEVSVQGCLFYVAGLTFSSSPVAWTDADTGRQLLPVLRKESNIRYPALFAEEAAGAIPLGVEVRITNTVHPNPIGLIGLLFLSGLIYPSWPDQMDSDVEVMTGVWNGQSFLRDAMLKQDFKNKTYTWVSLLTPAAAPAALPLPTETVVPF